MKQEINDTIRLTNMEKNIVLAMQADDSKRIKCDSSWSVKFSFDGKTIPFNKALAFVHSDLFWSDKRDHDVQYYCLTDLGKSIKL